MADSAFTPLEDDHVDAGRIATYARRGRCRRSRASTREPTGRASPSRTAATNACKALDVVRVGEALARQSRVPAAPRSGTGSRRCSPPRRSTAARARPRTARTASTCPTATAPATATHGGRRHRAAPASAALGRASISDRLLHLSAPAGAGPCGARGRPRGRGARSARERTTRRRPALEARRGSGPASTGCSGLPATAWNTVNVAPAGRRSRRRRRPRRRRCRARASCGACRRRRRITGSYIAPHASAPIEVRAPRRPERRRARKSAATPSKSPASSRSQYAFDQRVDRGLVVGLTSCRGRERGSASSPSARGARAVGSAVRPPSVTGRRGVHQRQRLRSRGRRAGGSSVPSTA